MFDSTTIRLVMTAIPVYCILYFVVDRWVAFQLVAACLNERRLERLVRKLMDLETNSRFRHRPHTGMKLLWRVACNLNVQLSLKLIEAPHSEQDRLSAVYLAGQVREAEPVVQRLADPQAEDAPARAAAAVLEQKKAMVAVVGR